MPCCTHNHSRPTSNAAASRADPTRTSLLRQRMAAEMLRRLRALMAEVRQLVDKEDAFGLKERKPLSFNAEPRRFQFRTAPDKVIAFREWLDMQIHAKVLTAPNGQTAWTAKYVESAYKKGLVRAYTDTTRGKQGKSLPFYQGTQSEFLRSAFAQPTSVEKMQLLYARVFEDLKGVTQTMSTQMSRVLTDGLANGWAPRRIARVMSDVVGTTMKRSALIARTEVVRAHAEGQLQAFEALGEDVQVLAEWSTAGDDRVCALCEGLEGQVLTVEQAKGLIPRHPNCRCTWIPAPPGAKQKKNRAVKKLIAGTGEG